VVKRNVPFVVHSEDCAPGNPPWCKDCGADIERGRWVAKGNRASRKGECRCSEWEWVSWVHPGGWRDLNGNGRMFLPASFEVKGE